MSHKKNPHHPKDGDKESTLNWRDVRAKLVLQYRNKEESNLKHPVVSSTLPLSSSNTVISGNGWAYESGNVIETGSLIVSHPSQDFAFGGLRQQYFYKSVVLVVEHTSTFTKGVILNRPTDLTMKDDHEEEWNVWYGGDVQGIHSEEESLLCLHRLNNMNDKNENSHHLVTELSTPILQDISWTPWEIAQLLVVAGAAKKDDFWLCAGYAGWAPGQLQNELERGNWFMVATDVDSIWRMIGQELTNPAGTDMWVQVMKRIGKESMTTCMPDQKFKDDMLKQWVSQKLLLQRHTILPQGIATSMRDLAPGTLVRASSPILLDEQVFHQSLVLILSNNDEVTTGVVLNRPTSQSIIMDDGSISLPLRFGGRFGLEGKGKPTIWLHCHHKELQDANVGKPISHDKSRKSTFWKCTKEDAESAITVGLAKAEDFVVVEGMSVWKKKKSLRKRGGNRSPPVEMDALFTPVDEGGIGIVWKLLLAQKPLNKNNAIENLEAANAAWMISGNADWMVTDSSRWSHNSGMPMIEQQHVQSLAYSALDKWIRLFLMKP